MSSETVTVLFTDAVSSTAHASRLDATAADALRRTHFALLRSAVNATGGVEVKNLGDGLMVVFTSPSRALACAVAMQQAVERHNRRAATPLDIRIGVSAGEAVMEDGDYFGEPVVEAARLCAVAKGGQILASDLVRLLVGRHAAQPLRPAGELVLKGLPDPVAAVEVAWEPEEERADGTGVPLPARLVAGGANPFAFCGRSAELDVLGAALTRCASDEQVHAVLVSGEPGIGKSTLAAHAGRSAHAAGAVVTYGGCEDGLTAPYQPWVAAISHLLRHAPDDVIDVLPPVHAAALAHLVPAHAGRLRPARTTSAGVEGEERFALLEGVTGLLTELSRAAPVLVLLDDLHWADTASLQLLRHVLMSPVPARLLVVATYRSSDLPRGHPLTTLLADLWREPRVERVALDGLGDADVVGLMTAASGRDISAEGVVLAHAVRRETDGNPFFVTELLRHLGESGAFVSDVGGRYRLRSGRGDLSLPSSVRDVVARRVERLGDDAVQVLSLAAVAGRGFRLDVLARAADRDEDELLDLLEAATAAAIVTEDAPGHYRFVHAIIQHTLYEGLGGTRRQRWHHRLATTLEAVGAGDAELAHHWLAAATGPTDVEKAVDYAIRAGHHAFTALAPADAAGFYQQALELLERRSVADADRRCTALLGLAEAQVSAGDAGYVETALEAGRVAAELGDTARLAQAALAIRSTFRTVSVTSPELLSLIETALDAIGPHDSALRAQLLTARCVERDFRDPARVDDARAALAIADRLGDPQIWLACVTDAHTALATPGTHRERRAWGPRLRETAAAAHPRLRMGAALVELHALIEAAEIADADEVITRMDALIEEAPLVHDRHTLLMIRSTRLLLGGDRHGAQSAADELRELGTRFSIPASDAVYTALCYKIRYECGGLDVLLEPFERTVASNPNIALMRIGLSRLYCEVGKFGQAEALLERELDDGLVEVAQGLTWLAAHALLAETAVDVGNEAAARLLGERLAPYERLVVYTLAAVEGCTAGPLARIAAMLGDTEEATRLFDVALDVHRAMQAPYWIARTLVERVEVGLGRTGDREEARALATAFGSRPLLDRLERADVGPRGGPRRSVRP